MRGGGPPWLCGLHSRFRNCGYRLTSPRQAILEVFASTNKHLSAIDVYRQVHKIYPGIGLTTVYRTLELLANMGMLFRFEFGDGKTRYELAEGPGGQRHHHHLICMNCGRVIDYTDFIDEEIELLNQTEKGLSKKYNFKITHHQIHFYGLCERCK